MWLPAVEQTELRMPTPMSAPTEGAPTPQGNDSGRLDGHTEGTDGTVKPIDWEEHHDDRDNQDAKEWDRLNRIRRQFE